jgi:hypothetical protein
MSRGHLAIVPLLVLIAFVAATAAPPAPAPDEGLLVFTAWLDRTHPGHGQDEGPARFRNSTVDAAYPGVRFYYVLTYTRGIQPPFENSVTLVAAVDDSDRVIPYGRSAASYRRGLITPKSKKDAKLAAAAVLLLSSCGERRYKVTPDLVQARKKSGGWLCTYHYDPYNSSWVRFDRKGVFQEFGGSAPPVP